MDAERQRFDALVIHTPHGDAALPSCPGPSRPSTTASSASCSGATATPASRPPRSNGRARRQRRRRDRGRDRPRRDLARRWSSTRSAGAGCWPAATATSRPTRRSRAGSRSTPAAPARTSRSGSTAATCPAGYGWSLPGRATSCGSGSAPSTRASTSSDTTVLLAEDLGSGAGPLPGQLDPPQAAPGDRGRRLLRRRLGRPLPAAHRRGDPDRPLLRDRARAASCAASSRGARAASRPPPRYAEFNDSHEWKFRWMLRVQRLIPRIPPRLLGPLIRLLGTQALRRLVLRPLPADRPAGVRRGSADDQDGPGEQQARRRATRSGLSGTWSRPNRPSRSITTEAVSWPVTVAAATPPAPIAETAISALVT